MLNLSLSLLAGAYSLELFPRIPSDTILMVCVVAATVAGASRRLRLLSFFLFGFGTMGLAAAFQLADWLDPELQGETIVVNARVDGFVQRQGDALRFVVSPIDQSDLPKRIQLSWQQALKIPNIGEVWRLHVRLRRPRGFANPAGFDYEGWLFRQGLGATGYVVNGKGNYQIHGEPKPFLSRVRQASADRIISLFPEDAASAVLMAIGIGARHRISSSQWDLYASTGVSHLMAISGLHIGLAAACTYVIAWFVAAALCCRWPIRDIAVVAAVLAAGGYALLSGFAVPARRAMLMAFVAGGFVIYRRRSDPGTLLAVASATIFLTDPLAILTPGFKLSFAAVAVIFYVTRQHVSTSNLSGSYPGNRLIAQISRLGTIQIALLTGLFPLTVLIFGRFTLAAPIVNLLVLPIFNFITVPFTLAGILLNGPLRTFGDALLIFAHQSIRLVLWIVTKAAEIEPMQFRVAVPAAVIVAILPSIYALLPNGWPGRKLAFIAMIATVAYKSPPPPIGCLDYHALDVGQGLAVVLRTRDQTLLFDTGPSFQSGSSAAELAVLPFLSGLGVFRIDHLIVSHADLDHAGGAQAIVANIETGRVRVGEPLDDFKARQMLCEAGEHWTANGVHFSVIHPRKAARWTGNNSSCVVEISVGSHRILLTGDIEAPVEKLLAHRSMLRRSSIVFVPHHGSRTSSSPSLVDATRPALAIVSAGYRNRWSMPREDVVSRWEASGARVLNIATSGAISQRLCRGRQSGPVHQQRIEHQKYWHDP